MSSRSINITKGGEAKGSAKESQLAAAELHDSTSKDVHPILNRCDGKATHFPLSLHIVMEH
jgi:hypothetical protein